MIDNVGPRRTPMSAQAVIGDDTREKVERAQRAAEEVRKAAYELHRDAESVFLAANATLDALLDLATDEEARKAEQRATTAELSKEYSRSG